MDAFNPTPPAWTEPAVHAHAFCCPRCGLGPKQATQVWINRYAPVYGEGQRRKWQEFYRCQCEAVWWSWSSDRPPSELAQQERELPPLPRYPFDS
jgi:hypothetical protein